MTEALMLAHGFSIDMSSSLVGAELATAQVERVVAGNQPIEVIRVRITEAGPQRWRGQAMKCVRCRDTGWNLRDA
jgi:hypothetical protein